MSDAVAIVERSLDELRGVRTTLIDELRKTDKLIDDQVKALDRFKPKVKKTPAKKDFKPNQTQSTQRPSATVTNINDKRSKHSVAGSKGGRPTKKVEFMKWLRQHKEIERERIPTQLSTSVQKTNEFVPELVREGLVKLEDRGDKHDPTEFVVITKDGLNA